jgi:uncharacterized protein (DUF2236 family)
MELKLAEFANNPPVPKYSVGYTQLFTQLEYYYLQSTYLLVTSTTGKMSLEEKRDIDRITPVPSSASSTKPQTATYNSNNSLSGLDNLQVLPKILQEGVIFVACGPAVLLQAAHPGLNTASSASSNLTDDLTSFLRAALSYLACLVLGSKDEKQALLARLGLGKPPLQSSLKVTSPTSQLWLVATIYATAADFYQRIYGTFDYRTAEAAYDEFALVLRYLSPTVLPSPSVGDQSLSQVSWPSTRAEFWKYWDAELSKLVVSAAAHDVATELEKRDLPRGVGLTKPVLRAVTIEMLPENIRDGYGVKSTFMTRQLYATAIGLLRPVYPCLPKGWRSGPANHYLEEVRKEIKS